MRLVTEQLRLVSELLSLLSKLLSEGKLHMYLNQGKMLSYRNDR